MTWTRLAAAVDRYFDDDALRERLRANAVESVAAYAPERLLGALVDELAGPLG